MPGQASSAASSGTPLRQVAGTGSFVSYFLQDGRYALRYLRRSPGFAAVAILTLALGIGANCSIFTILNTVMLARLPVGHPEQLVLFHWVAHSPGPYVWDSTSSYGGCDMENPATHGSNCSFSFPDFDNFRSHLQSFEGIAAYGGGVGVQVDRNGQATRANGEYVSGDYFSVLQVRPVYGRVLTPADDVPGAVPVAVLDFRYWQTEFNSDPKAVGSSVLFNGTPFTIAGVAPAEFYGLAPGSRTNFWVPLRTKEKLVDPRFVNFEARTIWLYLVGRVKAGVPVERARAEAEVMFRASLANEANAASANPTKYEQEHEKKTLNTDIAMVFTSAERGLASLRNRYSTQLFVLMAAAGLVLLIACANIANLLLARAAARRREIAVRLALGASRIRLVHQLLTESLLLAFLGCVTGLLVSYWASRGLTYVLFPSKATAAFMATFRPNYVVFGFSAAVAIAAAILFGLAPALTSTRVTPGSTLKTATSNASPSEGRNRLGRALVALEMALALVLVIGAGLFLRTLVALETLDPGFRTDHLLLFSISPTAAKMPEEQIPAVGQELQRRLAALPGVESVTWSDFPLLSGSLMSTSDVKLDGHPEVGEIETQNIDVGPGYFETMKIPVLSGRSITLQDCRKDFPGVWVNRSFAEKYLSKNKALGAHLEFREKPLEILGIVGDVKYESVKGDFRPTMYTAMAGGDFSFQLRTANNPQALENSVRKVVAEIVPNVPIQNVSTLREEIDSNLASENSMARLSSALGFLALLLAAIGIYGVLAYSVARRTGEIAIRMSLGAMPGSILKLVLREGLTPAFLGAALGLLAAWGLTRLVQQFLYGVKPLDGFTFGVATAVLFVIATLACVIPARRAMRVDPMVALRYE
jgi:predicted permease